MDASAVKAYGQLIYVNYVEAGMHTLLVADFLHTFPDEVRLMWPVPLSPPKALFFATRYYTLVHSVFSSLYYHPGGRSAGQCKRTFVRYMLSACVLVFLSEAILFFRIWAFSERNKKLSVYLLFHFITVNSAALAIMIKLLLAQGYTPNPLPIPRMMCMPTVVNERLLGVTFSFALFCVVTIMVVMVGVGLWKYRNFHSTLCTLFYRDGMVYFLCLSRLASTNIALTFLGPPALRFLLLEPQILAHAMLSTRLLLHLRKWAERDHVRGSARCLVPSTVGMPSAIVFGCPDAGTGGNGGRGIGGGNGCGELC